MNFFKHLSKDSDFIKTLTKGQCIILDEIESP